MSRHPYGRYPDRDRDETQLRAGVWEFDGMPITPDEREILRADIRAYQADYDQDGRDYADSDLRDRQIVGAAVEAGRIRWADQ